ncbi:MAG TPA: PAS domain-containing sensor histidine kinase, partial [Polyangiaceae bacterium]
LHELICDDSGAPIDYRYLDVNPAFERITGIRAAEAVGKTVRQLAPQVGHSYIARRGEVALTGKSQVTEGYDELLSRYCRTIVFSPQRGQFATVFEDITERKLAELALQENHEELERFTRAVSHDLKSPLVTVQTFLEYLAQDLAVNETASVAKDLAFMRSATEQMARLLNELLEQSRIGRIAREPEEVPLATIVSKALSLVAGCLATSRSEVVVTSVPVMLFGDTFRLIELFQNLLENAAKFMGEQPEPRIEVGVSCTEHAPVLYVRDNGSGFPKDATETVFGLFRRLHDDTQGTGIGLALVRRIVQVHGGKIWAESDGPGAGATFKFILPRTKIVQVEIGTGTHDS